MNQNDNEPAVNEFVQKGAEAASIVQGAVKTGKAVSGIAKGVASGGPYLAGVYCAEELFDSVKRTYYTPRMLEQEKTGHLKRWQEAIHLVTNQ